MLRYDHITSFKTLLPHVDIKTVQGILMLQGFINGYNKGIERTNTSLTKAKFEVRSVKEENKKLKAEMVELHSQIYNLNHLIKLQELWQRTGDEE
jgi:hypothetical protein